MVDWNKAIEIRIEWFYFIAIFLGIGIIAVSGYEQPINSDAIPIAVAGLVTISGVMTAFIGLWLVHLIPAKDELSQRLYPKHKQAIVFFVIMGILITIFGLNQFVFGALEIAYYTVLTGTLIITAMLLVIMTMVVFFTDDKEEKQEPAKERNVR